MIRRWVAWVMVMAAVSSLAYVMHLVASSAALRARVVGKSPDGWHRWQMAEWCRQAELANPGWKCPAPKPIARDVWKQRNSRED